MDRYSAWAPAYPPYPHNALMQVEQAAVLSLLPPVSGKVVLDAGCGTGRYIRLLKSLGAATIGIDASMAMVTRARSASARVARADMLALPLGDASCDVVVSGLALMDVSNVERALAEWARVLRPGGVAVYSTLHPIGMRRGWARTFEINGRAHELPTHWHSVADLRRACRRAGLVMDMVQQPVLADISDPVALIIRAARLTGMAS